ncbi:hypothetical protein NIHE141904_21100 [Enterobacter hormaechei]|nr:hypothetical protein NIHE141904_21100 [Enterobacter hormaechei]
MSDVSPKADDANIIIPIEAVITPKLKLNIPLVVWLSISSNNLFFVEAYKSSKYFSDENLVISFFNSAEAPMTNFAINLFLTDFLKYSWSKSADFSISLVLSSNIRGVFRIKAANFRAFPKNGINSASLLIKGSFVDIDFDGPFRNIVNNIDESNTVTTDMTGITKF